jgi:hypothetical protein
MATPITKFLAIALTMATSMQPITITMSMPHVGGLLKFNFLIYLYMPDLLYILFLSHALNPLWFMLNILCLL